MRSTPTGDELRRTLEVNMRVKEREFLEAAKAAFRAGLPNPGVEVCGGLPRLKPNPLESR